MTLNQKQDTRSVIPAQSDGTDSRNRSVRRPDVGGRYRTPEDEEAYRRSVLEQAKTDIAAGW